MEGVVGPDQMYSASAGGAPKTRVSPDPPKGTFGKLWTSCRSARRLNFASSTELCGLDVVAMWREVRVYG